MIDKRLQRAGVGCGLRRVEPAERDQDIAGESLRIHAGTDDERCAFDIWVLGHRDVDLGTGLLLESAFADVGDDTDDTGGFARGAVREFSNRVFTGPLAACARFISDNDQLFVRCVVP